MHFEALKCMIYVVRIVGFRLNVGFGYMYLIAPIQIPPHLTYGIPTIMLKVVALGTLH